MIIGVIEWESESLNVPSVYVARDETEAMHWAARQMQDYSFDGGGPIDKLRDTYRPSMGYDALAGWFEEMWEATTAAWFGIYALNTMSGFGEAENYLSGGAL